MFQTTRRRLALWYTTITAVVLLVFASGVYWYVRSTLVERVDDTLNHVVEIVQRSLVIEPGVGIGDRVLTATGVVEPPLRVNVEASFRDNAQAVEDDHIDLEWFSPQGDLLWSTLAEPLTLALHVNPAGETVRIRGGQVVRQVTQRIVAGHQILGYLRVSHPWFEVTSPTQRLMRDLLLGITVMVGAVAAIGWFLSGIAMAPVRESYQQLKQFTADASHELRNPIAVIQTNVQVALADPETDTQVQQQFEVIERLTRRLGRLVDDLLFLTRQESGLVALQRQPVAVDTVLTEVMEEQGAIAEDGGITLVYRPPLAWAELALTVAGDRDQLTRLFTNLISNGLQYTPPGGTVTLSVVASSPLQGRTPGAPGVTVQVQDTGQGIAPEALAHVFDRFYRADPARPRSLRTAGSGLGLAIAKVIVDNHRGDIHIESQLHQGTTVTVWLPLLTGTPTKGDPKLT